MPTEEYVTYRFHEEYYITPSLQWDIGGAHIPPEVFENAISTVSEKQNTINFLTGSVGSGKTTYIFNILFRKHKEWLEEKKLLIARLDIDALYQHSYVDKKDLYKKIHQQIYRWIEKYNNEYTIIDKDFLNNLYVNSQPIGENNVSELWLQGIRTLIERFRAKSECSIILFVDNLDFIYRLFDRDFFLKERKEDIANAHAFARNIVSLFVQGTNAPLSLLGISISFCFETGYN